MRLLVLIGGIAVIVAAGCADARNDNPSRPSETASPGGAGTGSSDLFDQSTTIEPIANLDPGESCDRQLGEAMVNALFTALNEGDAVALGALFPADEAFQFTLTPDILAAAETSVLVADRDHKALQISSHDEMETMVDRFADLQLAFTEPLKGGNYTDGLGKLFVGISPVLWQATGAPLEERGRNVVFGGGKTAIDCETRLFSTVVLSPLSFG